MPGHKTIVAAALAGVLVAAPAGADTPPDTPPPDDEALTTPVWKDPGAPLDLHWHLLALPEYMVQLAFSPVAIALTAVERYRLDLRLIDLLRITEDIKLTPEIKLAAGEGFGGGLTLGFDRLWDNELDIGALGRLDGDYEVEVELERSLAFAEGRTLVVTARAERDQNHRFYGVGPDTDDSDRRVIETNVAEVLSRFDLTGLGSLAITGLIEAGYRHEKLTGGTDATVPPVGAPGDTVMAPPDFGTENDYAMFNVRMRLDTRDTEGRPTRGVLASISGHWVQDITGAPLSAFGAELDARWFVPVLPDHRVLVLGAGMRMAQQLLGDHEIPLFALSTLGRKDHLRGYSNHRFVDDHAWWSVAEYRFPVYEYINTGVAAEAVLFVEAGQVAADLDNLLDRVRFDYGVGLRGGYDAANFFEIQLGFSSEGSVFGFALGKDL